MLRDDAIRAGLIEPTDEDCARMKIEKPKTAPIVEEPKEQPAKRGPGRPKTKSDE